MNAGDRFDDIDARLKRLLQTTIQQASNLETLIFGTGQLLEGTTELRLMRKEFKEILALPRIKLIPLQFIFTQYLRPMDLFVLDPGDVEKPHRFG